MVGLDIFAVWKFKYIEGVLLNYTPYDFLVTKYHKDFTTFFIHYDLNTAKAIIKFENKKIPDIICSFADLPDELKKLNAYEQKKPNECHSNALIPLEKIPTV